ncbi:nitrile hydratase subunit beta [Sodalis sp. RH22]|uniref:nitrile hydratase subunit beta n=1 Tax=unclassified Sodalis (in: enterobacteria) TaxID=2636512 RepID=UPI0039B5B28F
MNGIHDMGGLHGFGPVKVEADEPVFHSEWESRVFCITQLIDTLGIWNLDEHRHEIELMRPADYLDAGYYGRWLFAMERLLHCKGIVFNDELENRIAEYWADVRHYSQSAARQRNWPLPASAEVRWGAWRKEATVTPRYQLDQQVKVRNIHPAGHTRVANYIRGKEGIIVNVHEQAWVFPDTRAHYLGEKLQPVYSVKFCAKTLWGPQAEADVFNHVDLSEDHLEPIAGDKHE